MVNTIITHSEFFPDKKLLITHISGDVDETDIQQWEKTLLNALDKIPQHSIFKIFVNLYGFNAMDIATHKRFRTIIPLTLAGYGWKTGYVDLFEDEAKNLQFHFTRGIQCVAAAHAHHDKIKMNLYESKFGKETEHFFNDPELALKWMETIEVK